MSDQPSNKRSDLPEVEGGWTRPKTVGGWRQLEPESSQEENGGWRVVPAMPENLTVEPVNEGAWHLPKPEDTIFTPESELQVSAARVEHPVAPEDMELPPPTPSRTSTSTVAAVRPAEDEDEDEDDLESASGLGEILKQLSLVEPAPAPTLVLEETPAEEVEEEVEEDAFAFPGPTVERDALTQATGAIPTPLPNVPQTPAAGAGDYAAEQIRRLMAEQEAPAPSPAAQAGTIDPAEYARQQVQQLSGVSEFTPTEPPTPVEPMPAVDAEREALVQRFLETEAKVRELRQQYRNGLITREDLQNQLRQLLILDNNDVWWMMGVDTDTWYRFDAAANTWVVDTPPRPGTPRTETSPFDPSRVGASLPYLPDDDERTGYEPTPFTGGYTQGEDVLMPRSVPIDDPEATLIGTAGVNLPPVRPSDAQTTVGTQPYYGGETIPGGSAQPTIPSPVVSFEPAAPYTPVEEAPLTFDEQVAGTSDLYEAAVERQRQSLLRRALLVATLIIGGIFILGAIIVIYIVTSYNNIASQYTDEVAALANYEPEFQTARILDAEGNVLAVLNSQAGGARETVPLSEVSPNMIFAVVAQENERFFEDPGYDPIAIARAFLTNLGAGEIISGASTITQQIASNLVLRDNTPTAENKLREIVVASEIAQRYDKNFILQLYLNEIFFGNQSYGVEAAAQFYFDKPASELTLAESAMLAGLIPAPATYDPVTRREAAFDQMDDTLRQIANVGCLNFQHDASDEPFCVPRNSILDANGNFRGDILVQRAEVMSREYLPRQATARYPHFINYVQAVLERQFGPNEIFRRGFQVRTTLNSRLQDEAQSALTNQLQSITFTGVNTGTVMAVDPRDGAIRVMVGSPDFNNEDIGGQINFALTWQQPGSTIKPVVYLAALEGVGDRNLNGVLDFNEYLTPASILWDVPTQYTNPNYAPVNFDGRFRGPVSVRYALANSLNVPTVKAYAFIGNDKFVDTARRLGLNFLNDPPQVGLPTAVGATEVRLYDMMQAYATLANTGRYVPMYAIVNITDTDGATVPLEGRPEPVQRVQPEAAFLIQNILADNVARADTFGTNSPLVIPQFPDRVAAKTGTSNDARDLWTMGFTRNAVVGVWLGRADNNPTRGSSIDHAAPIWNRVMRTTLSTLPAPEPFASPGNIFQVEICNPTGTLPGPNCPARRNELFIVSQPPPPADQGLVVTLPVDTWTGFIANSTCPENVENRTFVNISDPFAVQWLNTPQGQPIARQLGIPLPPLPPPTQACDVNTLLPTARITSPTSGQVVQGVIQIQGAVSAQNFDRYQLAYAPVNSNNFTLIGQPSTQQFPNQGVLGQWDTRTVPNGIYTIRLEVFATAASGGGYLRRDVQVTVQNIQPTDTPTPLPPPPPQITPTTIPFPIEVTPLDGGGDFTSQGAGGGNATPTATINPGG